MHAPTEKPEEPSSVPALIHNGTPTDMPSLFKTVESIRNGNGKVTPKEYYHFLKVFHNRENAE